MKVLFFVLFFIIGGILHSIIVDNFGFAYWLAGLFADGDSRIILSAAISAVLAIMVEVAAFFAARTLCRALKQQDEKDFVKRANKDGVDSFEYTKSTVPPHVIERCEEMAKQSETAVSSYLNAMSNMGAIKKKQAEILIAGYSEQARQIHK